MTMDDVRLDNWGSVCGQKVWMQIQLGQMNVRQIDCSVILQICVDCTQWNEVVMKMLH